MQLSLQLPCPEDLQTCSGADSGSSSPCWGALSSFDVVGPVTPAAAAKRADDGCAEDQTHLDVRRPAYRRLQLEVPSTPLMPLTTDSSACASSARRVLPTSGSYSSVCSWLDQQVSKRVGPSGGLIAACRHAPVGLDPALELPVTPAQPESEDEAGTLPAPAFQLLGLL